MTLQDAARRLLHAAVPPGLRPAAKAPFYLLRSMLRRARRSGTREVTADTLAKDLAAAGVRRGDVLCVHGSLSRIGNVRGGGATLIAALQEAIGPEGTLLMPAYGVADRVFDPAQPEVDLRSEPSMTGALAETFRCSPGVLRSSHPFSSVCAWGRHAAFVTGGHADDPRICHLGSPLARFHQLGGKVMGIGITLGPVSFYHVVEDTRDDFPLAVYDPPRNVAYVDASGADVQRPVQRYKADLVRRRIDGPNGAWIRDRFTEDFEQRGIMQYFDLGAARCWTIGAKEMYEAVCDLAARNITIYTAAGDTTARWPGQPQ